MMSKPIENKVFMFMHCEGIRYMGFLSFDDPPKWLDTPILLLTAYPEHSQGKTSNVCRSQSITTNQSLVLKARHEHW